MIIQYRLPRFENENDDKCEMVLIMMITKVNSCRWSLVFFSVGSRHGKHDSGQARQKPEIHITTA